MNTDETRQMLQELIVRAATCLQDIDEHNHYVVTDQLAAIRRLVADNNKDSNDTGPVNGDAVVWPTPAPNLNTAPGDNYLDAVETALTILANQTDAVTKLITNLRCAADDACDSHNCASTCMHTTSANTLEDMSEGITLGLWAIQEAARLRAELNRFYAFDDYARSHYGEDSYGTLWQTFDKDTDPVV